MSKPDKHVLFISIAVLIGAAVAILNKPVPTLWQKASVPNLSAPECRMATISDSGEVAIDWPCAEDLGRRFLAGQRDQGTAIAITALAIWDRTAKVKQGDPK